MAHRNSLSTPSIAAIESFEPRQLLSGTTIDTASVSAEVQSVLEQPAMRPHVAFESSDATKSPFWEGLEAGSPMGMNDRVHFVSREDVLPTPEAPLTVRMQFSLDGNPGGMYLITRSNGTEFAMGLRFTVEYNGASIYLDDDAGSYVARYVSFPRLTNGTLYDVIAEDRGTEAHLRIEREGTMIAELHGVVEKTPKAGKLLVRKQDVGNDRLLNVPSMSVIHGMEPVPQSAVEQSPATLDAAAVDTVMSDGTLIATLDAEESASEESGADTANVHYNSETKEEFWEGTPSGGDVSLNNVPQILSRRAFMASPEHPTVVKMQFALETLPGGVHVVTRSDGLTYGGAANEYRAGVRFTVEYNGASIYFEDERGGEYVARYVSFASLRTGENYTLIAEDRGTEAVLRIEHEGQQIVELKGTVPGDASAGKIALRNEELLQGHRVDIAAMEVSGEEAAWIAPAYTAAIQPGDPRLAALTHFDYDAVMSGMERARVFEQSAFALRYPSAIIARHPLYKQGNAGVDGDIEADFRVQIGTYTDVVGDALLRGMEVRIAELQGVPTSNAMAMLDFAIGRSSGRYIGEFASNFGVGFPSKEAILAESNRLLSSNIDRLIENQAAALEQNWIDAHEGDTGPAQHVRTPEEEAALQARLREIMVYTATVIGSYSSDVRREFESAVVKAEFDLQEIYAEAGVTESILVAGDESIAGANITDISLIAMQETFGYTGEMPDGLSGFEGPLQFGDQLTQFVRTMIVEHPERWWSRNTATPSEIGVFVRTDTSASALYHGIAQQLWSVKDPILQSMLAEKSAVLLGVPAANLLSIDHSTSAAFSRGMQRVFTDAGYEHLFSTITPESSAQTSVLHPRIDGHLFINGAIPIRWDTATAGKQIDHTSVYLIDDMTTRHQASQTPLIEMQDMGNYARIPVERLGMNGENLGFKIAVWFTDGTTAGGYIENPFVVMWDGETSTDAPPADTEMRQYIEGWDILTEAQRQTIREALVFDFGDLPENNKNEQLIQWLLNTFVNAESGEEHLMIWDTEKNAWVGSAYDNSENTFNGECKYWVQNSVVKNLLSIKLPNNDSSNEDSESDYRWDQSDLVTTVATSDNDTDFGDLFQNQTLLKSGDIIQYVNADDRQHTIIIGSITETGIWVFDANYFSQSPAYHFISSEEIGGADLYSIYRIK